MILQFIKYIFVGGLGSLVFVIIGNIAALIVSPMLATFIAYVFSGITGYLLQMKITFQAQAKHLQMGWKYISLTLIMLGYGEIITYSGTELGIKYVIVNFFITVTVPLFSFPLQKFWVYK